MYIYIYYIIYTFILAKTIFNRPIGFSIVNSFFPSVRAQLWLELAHIPSSFHAIFQTRNKNTRRRDPLTMTLRLMKLRNSTARHIFHEIFPHFSQISPIFTSVFPEIWTKTTDATLISLVTQPCLLGPHHYIMPYMQQSPFLDGFTHGVVHRNFSNLKALKCQPQSQAWALGDLLPEAGNIAIKPSGSPRPPYQFLRSPPPAPRAPRARREKTRRSVWPQETSKQLHSKPMEVNERFSDHSPSPSKWSCQLRKYSIPKMSHKVMAKICQK